MLIYFTGMMTGIGGRAKTTPHGNEAMHRGKYNVILANRMEKGVGGWQKAGELDSVGVGAQAV